MILILRHASNSTLKERERVREREREGEEEREGGRRNIRRQVFGPFRSLVYIGNILKPQIINALIGLVTEVPTPCQ